MSPTRLLVPLAALLLAGCGAPKGPPVDRTPVPDFQLVDVNPASPRANQEVSPRDYVGRVSAWYFGVST